ncbi:acyltransferase family protein [Methylophilus aquaticus]|uniref:Acyltransferase n=1 Tax=Methylophilus aquaticus TaxID=1971610 RepID=A0ABT9JT94_9PROT|nr:acyltransferase [Methylophilus aquaticus]MDP8567755.1 acyltransferase [Methylophilus aquaticus]
MNYKPELDGIRAISILLVIISHAGFGHIIPGGLGVTIFFFVSGYLITSLLLAEADANKHIDLYRFYMRRFWRLLPPLIFFICIAITTVLFVNHHIKLAEIFSAFFYYANYYKIFIHYDALNSYPSPFNILWSLAIEEHFYILYAPLLAYTFSTGRFIKVVVIMTILPLCIRLLSVQLYPDLLVDGGYNYSATETRIDSIAMGCLLAVLFHTKNIYEKFKSFILNDRIVYAGLTVLLMTLLYRSLYFRETFRYSIQNVVFFMLVANLLFSSSPVMKRVRAIFSTPVMTHLGRLSYSLYLFHWLAIIYVDLLVGGDMKLTLKWQLCYWLATIVMSYVSYLLIEGRTKRYRLMFGSNVK